MQIKKIYIIPIYFITIPFSELCRTHFEILGGQDLWKGGQDL